MKLLVKHAANQFDNVRNKNANKYGKTKNKKER